MEKQIKRRGRRNEPNGPRGERVEEQYHKDSVKAIDDLTMARHTASEVIGDYLRAKGRI